MEVFMKRKKLIKQSIASLLSLSLLSAGIFLPAPHASAAKIKLNKSKLNLVVGKTYKLKLSKKKGKIKWTSSKKKVASVNAKGVIKAKKVGKATITAVMKGKKYKCKVTVKKAKKRPTTTTKTNDPSTQTKTPSSTKPTPSPVRQPIIPPTPIPGDSSPTPGTTNTKEPATTQKPDIGDDPGSIPELSELEQKITLQAELLANHLLITATNTNEIWVDDVVIYYNYYDSYIDNEEKELLEIAAGNEPLGAMMPGEKRYISVELSESFTSFDPKVSTVYPEASEANEDYAYMDLKSDVTITDAIDTENQLVSLNIVNNSRYSLNVPYAILFYNETKTKLIDAYANTLKIDAKSDSNEIINLPVDANAEETVILSNNYEIIYGAYTTETIDESTPYINNIKLTPQKITSSYTVFVDVTNNNKEWLTSLDVEYHFYDKDNNFLIDGVAMLQTMSPGETQTVPFNLDPKTIQDLDFNNSYAEISLQPNDGDISYGTTQNINCSTAYNAEEECFEITLRSTSGQTTEGTYLVKFYADTAKKVLIAAELYDYSLASGASYTESVYGATVKDENGNFINAVTCDATIQSRHTVK